MKVIYINIFVSIQCVYVYGIYKNIKLTIKKTPKHVRYR